MTEPDMHGKICIVTGSTSGIGKATALGLAKLDATVVMVARDKDRGEDARTEIQTKSGLAEGLQRNKNCCDSYDL